MKKILFSLLVCSACTATRQTTTTMHQPDMVVDGKLFASLFQQQAAEYRALCFQAYNLAHLRLDQALQTTSQKPLAVITDIDETVLDNSPYAVHQGLMGKDYDQESWYAWTDQADADTVPGAPNFLQYAASKSITVFYVTNRDEKERSSTLQNLQKFRLPNADNEHLILKQTTSSKEQRRQSIMSNYNVVLLIGDNLADFSNLFDKKPMPERNANASVLASQFGNRFIVLPNPGYGDWETSLYQYKYSLTPGQKDSIIRAVLKGY